MGKKKTNKAEKAALGTGNHGKKAAEAVNPEVDRKRRTVFVVGALLIVVILVVVITVVMPKLSAINGDQCLENGDYVGALEAYGQADGTGDTTDLILICSAMQQLNQGNENGLEMLDGVIERADGDTKSKAIMAKAGYLYDNGQKDEAAELYGQVDPDFEFQGVTAGERVL